MQGTCPASWSTLTTRWITLVRCRPPLSISAACRSRRLRRPCRSRSAGSWTRRPPEPFSSPWDSSSVRTPCRRSGCRPSSLLLGKTEEFQTWILSWRTNFTVYTHISGNDKFRKTCGIDFMYIFEVYFLHFVSVFCMLISPLPILADCHSAWYSSTTWANPSHNSR